MPPNCRRRRFSRSASGSCRQGGSEKTLTLAKYAADPAEGRRLSASLAFSVVTPSKQSRLVQQPLLGLDDGPVSGQPTDAVNIAAHTTLWVALQGSELDGATPDTERLVTRIYNDFDDLFEVMLVTQRPQIVADLRASGLRLLAHLQKQR